MGSLRATVWVLRCSEMSVHLVLMFFFLSVSINIRRDSSRGRRGLVTVRFTRFLLYLSYWIAKAVVITVIMRGGVGRKEGT